MKISLTLALVVSSLSIWGQTFSQINWGNSLPLGAAPASVVFNDTLVSWSFADGNLRQAIFRSFNRFGQLVDSNAIELDSTFYGVFFQSNSLAVGNKSVYGLLDYAESSGDNYPVLYRLSKSLDTLKTAFFRPDTNLSYASYDLLLEDSIITILGHYATPDKELRLFLARYDTNLNFQWYTSITDFRSIFTPGLFHGYYPYRLRREGNYYYLTGRSLYPNQFVEGFLVKTDLQGNKVWDKRYQFNNFNGLDASLASIGEDSLFIPHYFLSSQSNGSDYGKVNFRIVDTSGAILLDSVYQEEEINYSIEDAFSYNGDTYVVGHYFLGGSKALIWKLDKNLNTIWRRVYYYGDWEDSSLLYKVHQWSDGGLVATGTYYDRYLNPGIKSLYLWLLSIDSSGCLSTNCGTDIGVLEWSFSDQDLSIYPNPAGTFVNLELGPRELPTAKTQLRLFNISGDLVTEEPLYFYKSQARLDLNLESGTYLLELRTGQKLYTQRLIIE